MKKRVVLISKDALCKAYLPVYGNQYWEMPNLMELASKGTVFNRFYTAAPSSAMSYLSMFTGINPYAQNRKNYLPVKGNYESPNMYDNFEEMGYKCHVLWDQRWYDNAFRYSKCFGNAKFHNMHIEVPVGCHMMGDKAPVQDEKAAKENLNQIFMEIDNICASINEKLFVWIHLPHVLKGRTCYGSDMDLFDQIIGYLRTKFSDDCIFVSSDHGNMNGTRDKMCYGFDVYESSACIPLISPRIDGLKQCDIPISNTHIADLLDERIPLNEFVYCDSAYVDQPNRRIAIYHGDFKYIYNKASKIEELYDLKFDPTEQCNIISRVKYDIDRHIDYPLDQVYFYPRWEVAENEKVLLRKEFERIWDNGSAKQNMIGIIKKYKSIMHYGLTNLKNKFF